MEVLIKSSEKENKNTQQCSLTPRRIKDSSKISSNILTKKIEVNNKETFLDKLNKSNNSNKRSVSKKSCQKNDIKKSPNLKSPNQYMTRSKILNLENFDK